MKVRMIVNGVSFYTTTAAIKRGVGDFGNINLICQLALDNMRKEKSVGFAGRSVIYDNKMKRSEFDYQISEVSA